MEPVWSVRLGVLIVLFQVILRGYAESEPCSPGFGSELFRFRVHRRHLGRGAIIGTVIFRDCDESALTLFDSTDKRFQVSRDGTIKIKRPVTLHDGHKMVTVHAWDSSGKKHTALVRVEHDRKVNHHRGVQKDTGSVLPTQMVSPSEVPFLKFPESGGLRRRKREWVIPPLNIMENARGTFPLKIAQIRSSHAKETKMVYDITGEGANMPPVGIFSIDKEGFVLVSKPLDREEKSSYQLQATARSLTDVNIIEDPMEIIINVLDENDNRPVFTQNPFRGSVPESSKIGFEFMTINATDADDSETTINAAIRYEIIKQLPERPQTNMFAINPISGAIRVNAAGLDKEQDSEYVLEILATDREGAGYSTTGTAVITITDSNDHAPQFVQTTYNASVPENKADHVVVRMQVTDKDDEQSPAWAAKFRIISGNSGGFFSIKTGPNKQEGILSTAKPLDYELTSKYTLLVIVENDVPFAVPLLTSTATVNVNVVDINEAPVFDPVEKTVFVREDLAVDSEITVYTAIDPDIGRAQKVTYRVGNDNAGWLYVDQDSGVIRVKSPMDRESPAIKDGKYKATILAIDNDISPATGTGTLVIDLEDVNDNGPTIEERSITVCNKDSEPVVLPVSDKDGPGFAAPYTVDLLEDGKNNWTAAMNETKTAVILTLRNGVPPGTYHVVLKLIDSGLVPQVNTIKATVCACTGRDVQCADIRGAAMALPGILGILGAILVLLLLVLLLLLLLRRKTTTKKEPLINDDDIRDNIYYYDEEGGGEDDQDYDLSVLHRGLDNRPDVFRNDVVPTFMPAPQYRPRPANPEEIGTFIDDNLKAADNDPTAPPYDSLLVFDYEGGGSEAGSLSSLNSSSSGDQNYDCLHEWGPRFKKLADMYGGGDD